jgi:hypothetical protein
MIHVEKVLKEFKDKYLGRPVVFNSRIDMYDTIIDEGMIGVVSYVIDEEIYYNDVKRDNFLTCRMFFDLNAYIDHNIKHMKHDWYDIKTRTCSITALSYGAWKAVEELYVGVSQHLDIVDNLFSLYNTDNDSMESRCTQCRSLLFKGVLVGEIKCRKCGCLHTFASL